MTDTRPEPPYQGDDRAVLTGFLAWQRATFELKCAGLDAEQLARRSVEPSSMSLLGLIRHLSDVERGWWRRRMAGQDAPPRFRERDDDFHGAAADPVLVAEAWSAWEEEVAFADAWVEAAASLDVTGRHERDGFDFSARWLLIHLIEEYARHNGHADLLRERIDGATGE